MQVTSPDTLEKRVSFSRTRINRWPYWFMWECEKDGCKKASPYAECCTLSSLYLTHSSPEYNWIFKKFSLLRIFRSTIFIFIVILIMFRLICSSVFFRCFMSNSGTCLQDTWNNMRISYRLGYICVFFSILLACIVSTKCFRT